MRTIEMPAKHNVARELRFAKSLCGHLPKAAIHALEELLRQHRFSVRNGDVKYLDGGWYVTHAGLLRLAQRRHCAGIHSGPVLEASSPEASRWVFKAEVFKSPSCRGFLGYGDADPSNVSVLVRGAELRVAETRAINRALRRAYGISACSAEELGSAAESKLPPPHSKKPAQPVNGNYRAPKLRDRLMQLIRDHQLDPNLVKAFALDFCRTKSLREANRQQIESFVAQLTERAQNDRTSLLCQLNSYLPVKGSAA
jgi:hypothetical protein